MFYLRFRLAEHAAETFGVSAEESGSALARLREDNDAVLDHVQVNARPPPPVSVSPKHPDPPR